MSQVTRRARRQYRTPLALGDTALSAGILPRRGQFVRRQEAPYESRRFPRHLPGNVAGGSVRSRLIRRVEAAENIRNFKKHLLGFTPTPGADLAVVPRRKIAREEALVLTPMARRDYRTPLLFPEPPVEGGTFIVPSKRPVRRQESIEEARRFPRSRFPKIIPLPAPPNPVIPRRFLRRYNDEVFEAPRFYRRWFVRRIFSTASGADSLRYYFTGATSDGAAQNQQENCLGNFRSSTESTRVGFLISTPIPNVHVVSASRINAVEDVGGRGLGVGSVFADGPNTLRYIAPESTTAGPSITFVNGQTDRLDDGDDPSKWVRVRRTTASQLAGGEAVEFLDLYNDVFGMSDGIAAGGDNYRAIMLRNEFTAELTGIKLHIKPLLDTSQTTSVAQLGGAGGGTITGSADAFCHWPWKGWARIETSGGSLREIVYYSSRTANSLTVPSLGRGRLGTVAAAGAASDKAWSVPGIRIGFELANPLTNGPVQTIASETVAPNTAAFVGTAWSTAITAATGIQVGTLNYQEQGALWIHRELPAGVSAISKALNLIGVSFNGDGIAYGETLAGMYRIADTFIEGYEFHIGIGAEPDLTQAPTETNPTLPYDTTLTVTPGTTVYVAVNFRNRYDLVSQNFATSIVATNGSGSEVTPPPLTPVLISLTATAGGTFQAIADYDYLLDPNPGDMWKIYATTNGLDPTTGDLIDSVSIDRIGALGSVRLSYDTGAYPAGTIIKIAVAILRSSDSVLSALSNILSATSETSGPSAPTGVIGQRKNFLQDQN